MKRIFTLGCLMLCWFYANTQERTFIVPANKAYAEPYEPSNRKVGVRIPVGYPEDVGDVSNWTNPDRSVVWRLYQEPGDYTLKFDYEWDPGLAQAFNLRVSPCYAGLEFEPVSRKLKFAEADSSTRTAPISLKIKKPGYYKYELKPVASAPIGLKIHRLLFSSHDAHAQVNHTDYQSSPSVHINFSSTATTTKSYSWLYEDIEVTPGADPLHSFYMALGFYRGYLGIQTNSRTERRVLFSVWDSKDADHDKTMTADDFVTLVDRGEATTTNSFGGEGTGGQSYVKTANWETGKTVSFIMNVLPQHNNTVVLSAWYRLENQLDWNYIASWRAPGEQRYFDGFHSFLENYGYTNGQMKRMAEYFNAYGYEHATNKWIHLNKVRFSNTDGKKGQRVDFEQGVSPLHPDRFYLSSGGYTPTVKTANEIPISTHVPNVNLKKLEKRVRLALENEALRKNDN